MIKLTQKTRPDMHKVTVANNLGDIKTWSYSALKKFEQCPFRSYIEKVKKIREESGPAAERGTLIHQQAEDYVNGTLGELPDTLRKFKKDFEDLRERYIAAEVELEGEWGFDVNWNPVGYMESRTWARVKLDALVHQDETSARVIDYKTGKKWKNEMSHAAQALLYAISTFYRYPALQFIQTEIWYLDHAEKTIKTFTREQAMQYAPGWQLRAVKMTTATEFPPTPSTDACRWCQYGKGEDPICEWSMA